MLDVFPAFWSVQFQGRACFTGRQRPSEVRGSLVHQRHGQRFRARHESRGNEHEAEWGPLRRERPASCSSAASSTVASRAVSTPRTERPPARRGSRTSALEVASPSLRTARARTTSIKNSFGIGTPAITDGTVADTLHDYLVICAPFSSTTSWRRPRSVTVSVARAQFPERRAPLVHRRYHGRHQTTRRREPGRAVVR